MKTTRVFAVVGAAVLCLVELVASAALPEVGWPAMTLPAARDVELSGPLGAALDRGVKRIAQGAYTEAWLRADVSFEVDRIFTNYSGDVSGRFIELATLTSARGQRAPATLAPILASIGRFQKADGHFGVDVDLTKPLTKGSAPIPMLWGNARLLVGLVTAARETGDAQALAAARRLGDFYLATADQLCSPTREAEYRASGTYGDSYTCCYFPAIESLAMLHVATKDVRYLKHAQRMAEFFRKFDALPIDHSHGNLCAWRGILQLYEITRDPDYLERARAKWEAATKGGYVWPIGGIGEHWHVSYNGDEGCSESDWLRFNLDLWRFTGETRYLDMAERILHNQYAANQCENGGYGWRRFDVEPSGPIGTSGALEEWPWCCSFHGPLGLHFLKQYLAAGSERGVYVTFPLDFTGPVHAAERDWLLAVRSKPQYRDGRVQIEIELAPQGTAEPVRTTLWVRLPEWARAAKVANAAGDTIAAPAEGGYLRIGRPFRAGEKISVVFETALMLEARRFQRVPVQPGKISRLREVTVFSGPQVLLANRVPGSGRPTLLAMVNASGGVELPRVDPDGYATVALPTIEATEAEIEKALESARPILLRPWSGTSTRWRAVFVADLVVVPGDSRALRALTQFAKRAADESQRTAKPFFGEDLEKQSAIWLSNSGWKLTPDGLHVSSGDIGLIDGDGYQDYRFEFDLVLPQEGEGIAGWVVRAASENDCVMFQLQSADSPYDAPQFKTRPNTLRPHVRRNGQWTIADPVTLPKEVRRGETHRIAVECRGQTVEVFLDGQKVHTMSVPDWKSGAVGFRAGSPAEQGLFRRVSLRPL